MEDLKTKYDAIVLEYEEYKGKVIGK